MIDLAAIRAAIAERAGAVVRTYDWVPMKPEPPCLIPYPDDPFVTYDTEAAQQATVRFRGLLVSRSASDRSGQQTLEAMAVQVADALDGSDLFDTVDQVVVDGIGPIQMVDLDDSGTSRAYVVEIPFSVMVDR